MTDLATITARLDRLACISEAHTIAITALAAETAKAVPGANLRAAELLETIAAMDDRKSPLMMRELAAIAAILRKPL